MVNNSALRIYRSCYDSVKGDCPFVYKNEFGVSCCNIDHICQVEWFGCTPKKVIDKRNKKEEN